MIRPFIGCLILALLLVSSSARRFPVNSSLPPSPLADGERSIQEWVKCSETVDARDGVAKAFAAAAHGAFQLVVDCPVFLHIGVDIARPLFLDSGTFVAFRGQGRFFVDNALLPAFLLVNSHDIQLHSWDISYVGTQLYTDIHGQRTIFSNLSYYIDHNTTVPSAGNAPVTGAFSDITLKAFYATQRNVTGANPIWEGPTNLAGVLTFIGDTSDVVITNLTLHSPSPRAVDFVLNVCGFLLGFLSNQRVTVNTSLTSQHVGIPHHITFDGVTLDGIYMGFVGAARHSTFSHITSHRYSDLQDERGTAATVGGCISGSTACWFPPPHLFYFNFDPTVDPALFNLNLTVTDVYDEGIRVGRNYRNLSSGNCCSLKIGAINSTVRHYTTYREDGVVDLVWAEGLSLINLTGSYNSSFLANRWPAWRFTEKNYKNITMERVRIIDLSVSNVYPPMSNQMGSGNAGIEFTDVEVHVRGLRVESIGNVSGQVKGSERVYVDDGSGAKLLVDANNTVHPVPPSSWKAQDEAS